MLKPFAFMDELPSVEDERAAGLLDSHYRERKGTTMANDRKVSDAVHFEVHIRTSRQDYAILPWHAYLKVAWPDGKYAEQTVDGLNPVDLLKTLSESLRVVDQHQMGVELLENSTANLVLHDDPRQDYDDSDRVQQNYDDA